MVDWPFKMKGFFMFKYQHGFCILRCQPFHIGHDRLIKQMMEECAFGTVLIGSAQESGTEKNPLPYFTFLFLYISVISTCISSDK